MTTNNEIQFKDHVVQHPYRYKRVPVPGTTDLFDMIPTWQENPNEIVQLGTAIDRQLFEKLRGNVTRRSQTYVATANQTVFTLTDAYLVDQGRLDVYVAGAKLRSGSDFTETSPTSFTLTAPLAAGVAVEAVYFTANQAMAEDLIEQVQAAEAAIMAAETATQEAQEATAGALSANLTWKDPVASLTALNTLTGAQVGDTRQTRDTGYVYRFNGTSWAKIQEMDPNAINALDTRLSAQLAEKASQAELSLKADKNEVNDLASEKADITYVDNITQSIATGAPKGVYPSLSSLSTAIPTGNSNIYVTSDNGKWNYWNGSAWVVGGDYQTAVIQNAVNATSVISNGDFVNTTGWDAVSSSNGTLSVSNNELIYTVVGLVASSRIQQNGIHTPVVGHKYYVRGDIYPKAANTSYIAFGGVDTSIIPLANQWNKISNVVTPINTTAFRYYHPTNSGYVAGDTFKFRRIMAVDLTATYGAGNEPTLGQFETILADLTNSWFGGTIEIEPAVYLTQALIQSKVDKEMGKGLSSNDFTDSDKEILNSIAKKTIINVADYPNLRVAMQATAGANVDNQYEVRIDEGAYDLMTMYSQAEIENTSFVGFVIPDHVSLVGTGRKEDTIIKMEIPDTWLPATIARVAPIAYMGNGGMENLTVIGRNARYTVHDDYGYPDSKKYIKNCTFIKLAGLGNSQAWGEGSFSGMEFYFEDCEFITEYSQASYSTHNNLDFEKPSYHSFKNCKFINKGGYFGIRFITLASGVVDKVDMEGCYIDGIIKCEEYEAGNGCLYDIHMHSCSQVPILIDATDGSQPTYSVIEETRLMRNAETTTITKGTPVMYNNDGSVILRLGSNDVSLMLGVAMEDIPTLEKGTIKTAGFLPVVDTGLTLTKGDKVGVVAGALAKVTSGDYIGVVTRNGFIKLKSF